MICFQSIPTCMRPSVHPSIYHHMRLICWDFDASCSDFKMWEIAALHQIISTICMQRRHFFLFPLSDLLLFSSSYHLGFANQNSFPVWSTCCSEFGASTTFSFKISPSTQQNNKTSFAKQNKLENSQPWSLSGLLDLMVSSTSNPTFFCNNAWVGH